MAMLKFNAATVAPQTSDLLPAGKYNAVAVESEVTPTKAGTGDVAKFTFQIIEGQFSGRKVFARLNVRNQNQAAEQIGQAQLSALCHAAGVMDLQDTAQLHQRPVQIRVKIRKGEPGYDDQNEVSGYSALAGAAPAYSAPPAQTFAQPAASPTVAPATAPWLRTAAS